MLESNKKSESFPSFDILKDFSEMTVFTSELLKYNFDYKNWNFLTLSLPIFWQFCSLSATFI